MVLLVATIFAVAIKRGYQNIRRQWTEGQEGKENYVESQAKKRKYRSRRQRVGYIFCDVIKSQTI